MPAWKSLTGRGVQSIFLVLLLANAVDKKEEK